MFDEIDLDQLGELQDALDELFSDLAGTETDLNPIDLDAELIAIPLKDGVLDAASPDSALTDALEQNDGLGLPDDADVIDPFLSLAADSSTAYEIPPLLVLPNPFAGPPLA